MDAASLEVHLVPVTALWALCHQHQIAVLALVLVRRANIALQMLHPDFADNYLINRLNALAMVPVDRAIDDLQAFDSNYHSYILASYIHFLLETTNINSRCQATYDLLPHHS